jgi:hypothetical protein
MNTEQKSDKELWQSLALNPDIAPAAVSELEFAAWLEGRLPQKATERIDAAVATDAELRRAALELTDILAKPLPAAPVRMAVRAQALIGFEAERRVFRGWLRPLFPIFGPGFSLQRGLMASAATVVAAVGFMMGGVVGESYTHEIYASAAVVSPLGTDTTDDLNDLFVDGT